jgi:hypothetical protein
MNWIERFLGYAGQAGNKPISERDASDFKNVLGHLALKRRVSASMQNQAFHAILFFFRNVLGKETGNLADTARAKRGKKLPAVISALPPYRRPSKSDREVQALLGHRKVEMTMICTQALRNMTKTPVRPLDILPYDHRHAGRICRTVRNIGTAVIFPYVPPSLYLMRFENAAVKNPGATSRRPAAF